jgi:hypothetical protein
MNARGRLVDMNGRTLVVMRGPLLPVSAVYYCLLAVDEVCIIWLLPLFGCYPWLLPLPFATIHTDSIQSFQEILLNNLVYASLSSGLIVVCIEAS